MQVTGTNEAKSEVEPLQQPFAPPVEAIQAMGDTDDLSSIPAGGPETISGRCLVLDSARVLKATPRSFVLVVRGQSMANAGIFDGDMVVGEFTPEASVGAIVVALVDGESTLKRLVQNRGQMYLAAENPNFPNLIPLSELVIQGVVHTVVRRLR